MSFVALDRVDERVDHDGHFEIEQELKSFEPRERATRRLVRTQRIDHRALDRTDLRGGRRDRRPLQLGPKYRREVTEPGLRGGVRRETGHRIRAESEDTLTMWPRPR